MHAAWVITRCSPRIELPNETREFYHQLLRAYVIMGSGNLGTEIARLAELMVLAGISPLDALGFHLERVETLVERIETLERRPTTTRKTSAKLKGIG